MKVYQVWYNNREAWEDAYEWTGGLYTTRKEAEREITHDNYMIKGDWSTRKEKGRYVINKKEWAKELNRVYRLQPGDEDYVRPEECTDDSFAKIKEITLLETFIPEEDEDE